MSYNLEALGAMDDVEQATGGYITNDDLIAHFPRGIIARELRGDFETADRIIAALKAKGWHMDAKTVSSGNPVLRK